MNPLILLVAERAIDAILVGVDRALVRKTIETTKAEDIPAALVALRNAAIAAAQDEIDRDEVIAQKGG
jgi:hypothetical protein